MEKEKNESILIRENIELGTIKINQLKTLKLKIEEIIIPSFKNLEIGDFSTELLNDVLNNGSTIVSSMVQLNAKEDIKGIRTPSVRKSMLVSVDTTVRDFKEICKSVSNLECIELLPLIAIIENTVSLVPDAENTIRNGVKEYLNNKGEETIYFALQDVCKSLNAVMGSLGINASGHILDHSQILRFTELNDGKLSVRNDIDFTNLTH